MLNGIVPVFPACNMWLACIRCMQHFLLPALLVVRVITCITRNYVHSWQYSTWFMGLIRTVYAAPRQVLASKGGIADPDRYLQHSLVDTSISLVIWNVCAKPLCHELCKGPGNVGGAMHEGLPTVPLKDQEMLPRVWILEMLRQGTWHAQLWLLCSTSLDQHVVQNTICQLAKMGPMGKQWVVQGWVGDSNALVVEALEGQSALFPPSGNREHVTPCISR